MQHLSDFVFIPMANITLARREAYLVHLRSGIKQDTLAALRNVPSHLAPHFLDNVLKKAEDDIAQYECKKVYYHPYEKSSKSSLESQPGKQSVHVGQIKKGRGKTSSYSARPVQGSVVI